MKYIITLLILSSFLSAADFQTLKISNKYQKMDKSFTLPCNCGEAALLYPYRGENIPFAKTFPCPNNGCSI